MNRSLLATMMKPAIPSGSSARIQADRRISAELADSSARAWQMCIRDRLLGARPGVGTSTLAVHLAGMVQDLSPIHI